MYDDEETTLIVECCVCFNAFSEDKGSRPVVRMCGHSCCENCAKRITNKCPKCQTAFTPKRGAKVAINWQLLDQIRNQVEMERRFLEMRKDCDKKETEVSQLKVKAQIAESYEQGLKCKECSYPMKDGFFCFTCLSRSQEQIERMEETRLRAVISQALCGGCLKKHEKLNHVTGELEEIKKKQQLKKFQSNVEEKSEKIADNVGTLKTVMSKVEELLVSMRTKMEMTCETAAVDAVSHVGRMEEKLIRDLSILCSTTDEMVTKAYVLKQQIEDVIISAGSIADVSAIEDRLEGGWEEFDDPRPLDLCEDEIASYGTPQSDIFPTATETEEEPCCSKDLKVKEELMTPDAPREKKSRTKRRRVAISSDEE